MPAAPAKFGIVSTGEGQVTLRLPFPVSVNDYWGRRWLPGRHRKGGFIQTFISKNGERFRENVLAVMRESFGQIRPVRDRLDVKVVLFPPNRRRFDLDNLGGKALLDALTHAGVWDDDEQIDRLTIERGPVVRDGACEVTIRVIPQRAEKTLFEE